MPNKRKSPTHSNEIENKNKNQKQRNDTTPESAQKLEQPLESRD